MRGDAVAGILILVINARRPWVGVMQHNMASPGGCREPSPLVFIIGDGLVAQTRR